MLKLGFRHVMVALMLFSTMMSYLTRLNLSTAIVAMVRDANSTGHNGTHANQFDWNEKTQGVILGSFFYGYFFFQIFSGRLADSIGPRILCSVGLLASAIINLLTPILAEHYTWLVASRVLLGIFQSTIFPSSYALISMWIPDKERSTANSLTFVGSNIGLLITSSVSGFLCRYGFAGGWPSAFYVPGLAVLVFSVIYFILVRDDPKDHWLISEEELQFVQENINRKSKSEQPPVPWRQMLTDATVWAGSFSQFCMVWTLMFFSLKLPDYMKNIVNLPVDLNGLYTTLIYLGECISLLIGGMLADWLLAKNYMPKTKIRKIFQSIATIGSAALTVTIPMIGTNRSLFLVTMSASMFLYGASSGGIVPLPSDLSGEFSATIFSIFNAISMTNGFICPLAIGWVLDADPAHLARQWDIIWYFTAALRALGGVVFIIFARADRRQWFSGGSSDYDI